MTIVCSAIFILFLGVLISDPSVTLKSFNESYLLIIDVILPSVFPFLIASEFLVLTNIKDIIALPCRLLFKLFKLPSELAPLFTASVLGGYPAGINALSAGCEKGLYKREEAYEFIPFLVNAGPGFVILAVGERMFGSLDLGVIFYLSQLIAALAIGKLLLKTKNLSTVREKNTVSYSEALIISVNDACSSMICISGFVFLFSIVNNMILKFWGENKMTELLMSFLEVTNGCKLASKIKSGYLLCSFLISFSGLSCIYQIKSVGRKNKINTNHLLFIKLCEGILAVFFTFLIVKLYPITVNTTALLSPPLEIYTRNRILEFVLIAMMFMRLFADMNFSHK